MTPRRAALVLAAAGAIAAPASAATEVRLDGWGRMAVAVGGDRLVYGGSSAVTNNGYSVYRTDTFMRAVDGSGRLSNRRLDGIVMRTSAGRTTGGQIALDPTGRRHLLLATGAGFAPQLIFCCRASGKDYPVESTGRTDGPETFAATLDGQDARALQRRTDGTTWLVTHTVSDAAGAPFRRREARRLPGTPSVVAAVAPGIVAWVDETVPREIRVASTTTGSPELQVQAPIPVTDTVLRVLVTPTMIVALTQRSDGYALERFDGPAWTRTEIWTGPTRPTAVAAGDRTVVLTSGTTLSQQAPGQTVRTIARLRGIGAAVATDGRRVATIERITVRVRGRTVRKSAITVRPLITPPTAVTP